MIDTITCVIVEDNLKTKDLLKMYVADEPSLKLVADFDNGTEAQQYLLETPVMLLIVDIRLPDMDGFELIDSLPRKPMVILCTGYNKLHYAMKSYDLDAVNLLSKPFSHAKFAEAIARVRKRLGHQHTGADVLGDKSLFLPAGRTKAKVYLASVIYIESVKNYVDIHFNSKETRTFRCSLKELEEKLPLRHFIRIHKSYIVAVDMITEFDLTHVKVAHEKVSLPLGKAYREAFNRLMEKLGGKQDD